MKKQRAQKPSGTENESNGSSYHVDVQARGQKSYREKGVKNEKGVQF